MRAEGAWLQSGSLPAIQKSGTLNPNKGPGEASFPETALAAGERRSLFQFKGNIQKALLWVMNKVLHDPKSATNAYLLGCRLAGSSSIWSSNKKELAQCHFIDNAVYGGRQTATLKP